MNANNGWHFLYQRLISFCHHVSARYILVSYPCYTWASWVPKEMKITHLGSDAAGAWSSFLTLKSQCHHHELLPQGFPGDWVVKNLPAYAGDARDTGSIPRSGRSPGKRNGKPLWSSCLENCVDRGAWQATVRGDVKTWTELGDEVCMHTHTHTSFKRFSLYFRM